MNGLVDQESDSYSIGRDGIRGAHPEYKRAGGPAADETAVAAERADVGCAPAHRPIGTPESAG